MSETHPIDWLLSMPAFATSGDVALKPGFERIEALLEGMGQPQKGREIILIAGTNGKGSTASMLAALSTAAGIRTGLHTSPHLLHVGERMRVDGMAPDETWLNTAIARWRPLFESVKPSFFEATLALSLHRFAECNARRWVVEIGLGGRLDAANVLDADAGILTSVGRDHMHLLGPTLAHVAVEKAAIARTGKPFVLGPLSDECREAALAVLERIGARIVEPDPVSAIEDHGDEGLTLTLSKREVSGIHLPFEGYHQRVNALLALEALDQLHDEPVSNQVVRSGFTDMKALSGLRARQEWVLHDVMVDVGHNEDALRSTLTGFLDATSGHRRQVILGFLADKDLGSLGAWLWEQHPDDLELVFVDTDGARGLSALQAAEKWQISGWSGVSRTTPDPVDCLREARRGERRVLVCGSYRLASAVLSALESPSTGSRKLPS